MEELFGEFSVFVSFMQEEIILDQIRLGGSSTSCLYPGTQKDTNTNSTVGTKCLWVGDSDNALSLTEQTTLPCLQTCMNCLAFYGTHVYIQMVTTWPKIKVLNIIWGYRRL